MPVMFRDRVQSMTDAELEQELLSIRKLRGPIAKRRAADIPINRLNKELGKMSLEELEKLLAEVEEEQTDDNAE